MPKNVKLYLRSKKDNAKRRGYSVSLTEADVQQLLDEAGITVDQIGLRKEEYVLGRYGDTGNYDMGNCRFITRAENLSEQTFSEETRRKMSIAQQKRTIPEEVRKKISAAKTGTKLSEEHRRSLSVSHMGHRPTEETRKKMSEAQKKRYQ